jgi:putative transposase
VSAEQKRVAARHLVGVKGFQERRVCRLLNLARSSLRYQPEQEQAQNQSLIEQLKAFAKNPKKRRRGYRLVHQEINQERIKEGKSPFNHKRIHRLWRGAGLAVEGRRKRKYLRRGKPATDLVAARPNATWCFDFVREVTLHGQVLRIFCVSDEFTRECLAMEVGTHFSTDRVVKILESLMEQREIPGAFRMDNGPEFVAHALRGLCHHRGIDVAYIDPGKPWQNGFAESFHSRLRDEFMDGEVFYGVKDAQVRLNGWRRYFNCERLHSSLGYVTPVQFAASFAALEADEKRGGSTEGLSLAEHSAPGKPDGEALKAGKD